jgi:choline dehydrogenase-like flavoprotein
MSGRKFRNSEVVDFAIVGSGAAGGVIARELAQAGLSVVLFEQGSRLAPAQFDHDEIRHWYMAGMSNDVVTNPQTFRTTPEKRAEQAFIRPALWYARTVGGSTAHYTANYWRLIPIK